MQNDNKRPNSQSHSKNNNRKNNFQKGRYQTSRNDNRSLNNQDNRNKNRNSFQRNNNYGFPRIENEPKEERTPVLNVPVDDHPRAMVLPFDQKAVDDVKPRKYTSGFEIFKIPMALARWLTADDYLSKLSSATGITFADKSFLKIEGEFLPKLKAYSDSRLQNPNLEKAIRPFYKYLSYFANYAIENKTAVVFDL